MLYEVYCRAYQKSLKYASVFLAIKEPKLIEGENSLLKLPKILKEHSIDKVLIVTDS